MLNVGPLGAGAILPWVSGAASQSFSLFGEMACRAIKYAGGSGSLALTGDLGQTQRVVVAASKTLMLIGSLAARVLRNVHGAALSFLSLGSVCAPTVERCAAASQPLSLEAACTAKVWAAQHGSGGTALQLVGVCSAYQVTAQSAPDERTTGAVDISPRQLGAVVLGGEV